MVEVVVVSGARTAIGTYGGSFRDVSAPTIGSIAIKAALERAGVAPDMVEDVVMGCVGQVAEDAYVARTSAFAAGIPKEVPAFTVNRLCGSGLQAIGCGAQEIISGAAEIVVAGGVEAMSRYLYFVRGARWGLRMGSGVFEDGLVSTLNCPFNHYHMGVTAENLSVTYGIAREDQDRYALESHQKAVAAIKAGRFKEQIVPVTVPQGKAEPKVVDTDEHPRADTSLEKLAKLAPAFKPGGTVTAGNASGINDAAAAVVLMSAKKASELGIKPKLRFVCQAVAGVDPSIMGIGPAFSTPKALRQAGLRLDQMDLVEANEAFAAQALAAGRLLGFDWSKVNPNGGGVGLGHPVGATGAILTVKLMYEMARTGGKYGLATLCIGGGQGITTIFENLQ
ncbi:MAG: acetyl-CoA C-acetyltransferase [Chloroflexi bacterium]|nr:acetyl-CoA C-acetyltransferase [Chloroflexota bacterium]